MDHQSQARQVGMRVLFSVMLSCRNKEVQSLDYSVLSVWPPDFKRVSDRRA